jgi:hypothetical protein
MRIFLVTFADEKYSAQQKFLENKALDEGFDGVFSYTKEWLNTTSFYTENKHILDYKKGCGYWLWKPYILRESFKKINDDDILVYLDCGDMFDSDFINFIKETSSNEITITPGQPYNFLWCKKDCFVLMGCDNEKYWYGNQVEAGALIIKKTKKCEDFVNEWLGYCLNENILTDIDNIYNRGELKFNEHRWDQSVLSNLVIRHNITPDHRIHKFLKFNVND